MAAQARKVLFTLLSDRWRAHLGLMLFLCLVLGFQPTAPAQSQELCVPDSAVIYVNGVTTTREGAIWATRELAERHVASQPQLEDGEWIRYAWLWNPTYGAPLDILEAALQSGIDVTAFMEMFTGLTPWSRDFRDVAIPILTELTMDMVEHVEERDLLSHIAFYEQFLNAGHNVVVVSHSQGNLFANRAYDRLRPQHKENFAVVGVASPDDRVAGDPSRLRYTTLGEDLVAFAFTEARRLAGMVTLDPTTLNNIDPTLANSAGHAFVEAYLAAQSVSERRILDHIETARAQLKQGDSTACNPTVFRRDRGQRVYAVAGGTAGSHVRDWPNDNEYGNWEDNIVFSNGQGESTLAWRFVAEEQRLSLEAANTTIFTGPMPYARGQYYKNFFSAYYIVDAGESTQRLRIMGHDIETATTGTALNSSYFSVHVRPFRNGTYITSYVPNNGIRELELTPGLWEVGIGAYCTNHSRSPGEFGSCALSGSATVELVPDLTGRWTGVWQQGFSPNNGSVVMNITEQNAATGGSSVRGTFDWLCPAEFACSGQELFEGGLLTDRSLSLSGTTLQSPQSISVGNYGGTVSLDGSSISGIMYNSSGNPIGAWAVAREGSAVPPLPSLPPPSVVVWEATGVIGSVEISPALLAVAPHFATAQVGQPFTVHLTFDPNAPVVAATPAPPGMRYDFQPSSLIGEISIGGDQPYRYSAVESVLPLIRTRDGAGDIAAEGIIDGFSFGHQYVANGIEYGFQVVLRGSDPAIIDGPSLPSAPAPQLTSLEASDFSFFNFTDNGHFSGRILSIRRLQ